MAPFVAPHLDAAAEVPSVARGRRVGDAQHEAPAARSAAVLHCVRRRGEQAWPAAGSVRATGALIVVLTVLALGAIGRASGLSTEKLENNGGHYRFANLHWKHLGNNLVEFTLTSAWRRDYSSAYWQGSGVDGLAIVGDVIHLNGREWPIFSYGDDSMTAGEFLKLHVQAYSAGENWVFGESTVRHQYATPNKAGEPWVAAFTGCCKLSDVNNAPHKDAPWRLEAHLDLARDEASPRLAASPVISLPSPPLLPTPSPSDTDIPTFPVSFMVPGYHPIVGLGASVALADPLRALSGTLTPIDVAVNGSTGEVTLQLHGIAEEEAAREGRFYFLRLNCTSESGGAVVEADLLLRILRPGTSMPRLAFAHASLANLPGPTNLTGAPAHRNGADAAAPRPRFYPEGAYVAYVGFEVDFTISAEDPTHLDRMGFSVAGLPPYARMSAVRGLNPVQMTTYWVPCSAQDGRHVICYEAADDKGNTSTPECVDVSVLPDPPPQFAPPVDDGRVGNMSADVIVTMGATKAYTITAFDANCLDALTLTISPDTPLPEGAVFSPQAPAPSTVACERRAADQTVAATLSWDAPHTFGGTVQQICFRATDACGECECAGGSDTVEACVTFRVAKCRYSIGQEHELAEVGRLYGADWLQLWKMNPEVKHPDYILFQGQSIDIGRMLSVGPNDSLFALARRYGTTVQALYDLNRDLGRRPELPVGYELCVLPNSCVGQAESAVPVGSEYRAYLCEGNLNTNGAVFATLEDCRLQCGERGLCSSVSAVQ